MTDPLFTLDSIQRAQERSTEPPTEAELWQRFLDGSYTFEEWVVVADALYPATRAQVVVGGLFDAIIAKREAEGGHG